MKQKYFSILVFLLMISSCKEETIHGCLDSNALNYNDNAIIDNNSCCFNCYEINHGTFLETLCGSEVTHALNFGYSSDSVVHLWTIGGDYVPPGTEGALPAYNSDMCPVFGYEDWDVVCY